MDQQTTRLRENYRDEIKRIVAAATELANSDQQQALNMLHSAKAMFSQHKFLNDELHPIDDAIKQLGDIQ